MTWKVLISAPYLLPVVDEFREFFDENQIEIVIADVEERMEEAQLLPLIADFDGIICGDDRITERVIAAAPRLKVIAKWGTGIDSIDSEAARRPSPTATAAATAPPNEKPPRCTCGASPVISMTASRTWAR